MFGHMIDDPDLLNVFAEKRSRMKIPSFVTKIKMSCQLFYDLLFGPRNLIKTKNEFFEERQYDLVRQLKQCSDSTEMWQTMLDSYHVVNKAVMSNHPPVSMGSSIKNTLLKVALEGAVGMFQIEE